MIPNRRTDLFNKQKNWNLDTQKNEIQTNPILC